MGLGFLHLSILGHMACSSLQTIKNAMSLHQLENLLLSSDNVLKIADFGWVANILGSQQNFNFCGTVLFLRFRMCPNFNSCISNDLNFRYARLSCARDDSRSRTWLARRCLGGRCVHIWIIYLLSRIWSQASFYLRCLLANLLSNRRGIMNWSQKYLPVELWSHQ